MIWPISKLFGRERRDVATSDPYLAEYLGMKGGVGGYVDTTRASGLAVAQACISVIGQNLAAMPLNVYQRTENGGRDRATNTPLFGVMHDMFNEQMTAFEGREYLIWALLTNGNAYARIETNRRGQVVALYPINPALVAVERLESGRLRYRVSDQKGRGAIHLQEEILHLRYRLAPDGIMGLSPIQMARETFGLALCQQDQAAKQAAKAFRPEGGLIFPQSISGSGKEDALEKLRVRIESQATTSGILVLDGGVDWKPFALSSKDAEFLESRKLTNMDVARIFSVPPTVVGITDNATYSNVDGESRALVVRCLAPMARRIEQAMNAALLTTEGRKRFFIEHDLAGLLRGDQKARYEAYRIGREWGWLSPNEIRGCGHIFTDATMNATDGLKAIVGTYSKTKSKNKETLSWGTTRAKPQVFRPCITVLMGPQKNDPAVCFRPIFRILGTAPKHLNTLRVPLRSCTWNYRKLGHIKLSTLKTTNY